MERNVRSMIKGKRKLTPEELYIQEMMNKAVAKKRNRPSENIIRLTPAKRLRNELAGGIGHLDEDETFTTIKYLNVDALSYALKDLEVSQVFKDHLTNIQIASDIAYSNEIRRGINSFLALIGLYGTSMSSKEKEHCRLIRIIDEPRREGSLAGIKIPADEGSSNS